VNKHRIRYWLAVSTLHFTSQMGATPTKRVHKLLEHFGLVPKAPTPLGSKYTYEKPPKEYKPGKFMKQGMTVKDFEMWGRSKIQTEMNLIARRQLLQQEALANLGENSRLALMEDIKTEEIESEEADVMERRKKFDELLKRFEKHKKEKGHLRGNDLRYNLYLKKMQKLTRVDLGLDVEAYKDYVNNLKQFANINQDFEIFARDDISLPEQ